ncbi:MAG: heme A synthase [Thermomicrobiales bacterium]|nr:heme A synthase [Thermomicrobiales bacterium]
MDDSVRRPHIDRWLKPLAVAAAIGMMLTLLMGATVTNTNSGEGCGRSWPLCGGEFGSREMIIETSHRLVTGVEGFLVLFTGIGLWRTRGHRREARVLVALMWISILVQSGMGAWAVKSPQSSMVMALHFGFSMIAVTATALTVEMLYRGTYFQSRTRSWTPPALFRWGMWFSIIAMYGIAYLGAYVRHSDAVIACYEWPACNDRFIPVMEGPEAINFAHRIAAVLGTMLVFGLFLWARSFREQRPDIEKVLMVALITILLQSLAGGLVVLTTLSLISTLLHAALMTILFVALCIGCRMTLPMRARESVAPAPSHGAAIAPAGD